jgi:hypothetical protein
MIGLLFLTSVLLATSGVVKIRAAGRLQGGVPLLAAVELVSAVAVAGLALSGSLGPRAGFAAAVGSVGLVVISSASHARGVRDRRRRREASEAARLATFIRYPSGAADDPRRPS